MKSFPEYTPIDLTTWPRREHFAYYFNQLKCATSFTCRLDVTKLLDYAHQHQKRFYGCFLYAASLTVNQMDSMRMMIDPDGKPGIWKTSHPNFTVFHDDDETFSDLWSEYDADFEIFYRNWETAVKTYGLNKGIKGRPEQPLNFFCISCIPWLDFTSYNTYSPFPPALFPIITFGRYSHENGRVTLPLALTIAHAAADGYHSSLFFKKLQENLNSF